MRTQIEQIISIKLRFGVTLGTHDRSKQNNILPLCPHAC